MFFVTDRRLYATQQPDSQTVQHKLTTSQTTYNTEHARHSNATDRRCEVYSSLVGFYRNICVPIKSCVTACLSI